MDRHHETLDPDAAVPSDFQRIYIGSLDYFAKPADVETLLVDANLETFQKIHISIDPISGRNPGYCFVEFSSPQEASHALNALAGKSVLGRVVKLGPCVPKGHARSSRGDGRSANSEPVFQRWGDWKGADEDAQERQTYVSRARGWNPPSEQIEGQQGPYAALNRLQSHTNKDGTRIRIDGLDKMMNQEHNDSEIRSLLAGFEVVAIGKRVIPYSLRSTPGNHHHCYVDLASHTEADRAVKELNGAAMNGGAIRVSIARDGRGSNQHGSHQQPGRAGQNDYRVREERSTSRDIMQKSNWRNVGGA
ncbi:hypothetical protein QBC40DRAFT_237390 [Triangularia verruculosa]|uniref:RRM domain-containing protein n=1 Tax=Triangularia verruculosa TaxID=2587418 RepID=A0AAN6X7T7_9PEZI|nr:hypothetical protein QBC40DRAFT_237390 [Triangularia verruculosa]